MVNNNIIMHFVGEGLLTVQKQIRLPRYPNPRLQKVILMDNAMSLPGPLHIKEEPRSPETQNQSESAGAEPQETSVTTVQSCVKTESSEEEEEEEDFKDGIRILTHKEALEEFRDGLTELIIGDQLLNDLPSAITLEEVNSLISLEHGQAIIVNVRRADDVVLPVVVVLNGTVIDLKKAIERHVMLKQHRDGGTQHISWRHIWKSYWLYFDGQKLNEDNKMIKDYGIGNKDEVTFIKKLRKN